MRKIKKFRLENSAELSPEEMKNLLGGEIETNFNCRTGESCKLFIEAIGIVVEGTCDYYANGTTVSCFCYNGSYSTTPGHSTSCWK